MNFRFVLLSVLIGIGWTPVRAEMSIVPSPEVMPEDSDPSDGAASSQIHRVDSAIVFIDGVHIPCPLDISGDSQSGKAWINGHEITIRAANANVGRNFPANTGNFRRVRRAKAGYGAVGNRFTNDHIVETLDNRHVMLAFGDAPAIFIAEFVFFSCLLDPDPNSDEYSELLDSAGSEASRNALIDWLDQYVPSEAIIEEAREKMEYYRKIEDVNHSQISASATLTKMTYPMTMFGLIVGVYAFGHLMMTTPKTPGLFPEANLLELMSRATVISVALICAHAILDLSWTLLTSQAGQMREINPLGARFIDNPMALVAFKAVATLGACGLLVGLRHHRFAQTACWWMCLVCTILTFRWLIFSSMLV